MWGGYIYFLQSFTVQNRPPGNKIATTIFKTTIFEATGCETQINIDTMINYDKVNIHERIKNKVLNQTIHTYQ